MKERKFFISIFLGLLLMFSSFAMGAYYTDVDFQGGSQDGGWYNIANCIDNNTASYGFCRERDAGKYAYFQIPISDKLSAVWVYCYTDTPGGAVDSDIRVSAGTYGGGGWQELYDGTVSQSQWVKIDADPYVCLFNGTIRITHNSLGGGRFTFVLYEITYQRYANNQPAILSAFADYPTGSSCFGLYPEIYIPIKDVDPIDHIHGQLWLKGVFNNTWWKVADEYEISNSDSIIELEYDGKYFSRYGQQYSYSLNYTDNDDNCSLLWHNGTYSFTILPCPLDQSDPLDSLPSVAGLTNADCWELVSVFNWSSMNKNQSVCYNESNNTKFTWRQACNWNLVYDGWFYWNSSKTSYDNVSMLESYKGYWVYFYDKNVSIINPFSEQILVNRNDTSIDATLLWVLTELNVAWSWNGTNLIELAVHDVQDYSVNCPDNDESLTNNSFTNFSNFDGLDSWINITFNSWFNDTNPDTLEISQSIDSYNINCSGDVDESLFNDSIFNLSLLNDSWVNIHFSSWFNDTNPDTLETGVEIVNQSINNTGNGSVETNIYMKDNFLFGLSIGLFIVAPLGFVIYRRRKLFIRNTSN